MFVATAGVCPRVPTPDLCAAREARQCRSVKWIVLVAVCLSSVAHADPRRVTSDATIAITRRERAVSRDALLFSVPAVGTPAPLALLLAADQLTGLKLGWLKGPITIATSPLDHTGVCPTARGQAKNLEAFVECVPRPRQWLSQNKTGENAAILFRC